jgi:hypothetical protein
LPIIDKEKGDDSSEEQYNLSEFGDALACKSLHRTNILNGPADELSTLSAIMKTKGKTLDMVVKFVAQIIGYMVRDPLTYIALPVRKDGAKETQSEKGESSLNEKGIIIPSQSNIDDLADDGGEE